MKIVCTDVFKEQYKSLLSEYAKIDFEAVKRYKVYLDTVLLNMPTKLQKFPKSHYFEEKAIFDLEHQGHIIPFYFDEKNSTILLLGLFKKENS
jgi:hypothetical protein